MSINTQMQPAATNQLSKWVAKNEARDKLAAILGDTIPVDQFIGHVLMEFQDIKFAHCSDKSKFKALHEAAALGLSPRLGQIVFVPYKGELVATPQWQGYKAVMERHPKIEEVTATLVHVADAFQCDGSAVIHNYNPFDPARKIESAKDIQGGYCKIDYTTGRLTKYHFVPVSQIIKAQGCALSQGIWTKWYAQMALKTCYRDCYARRAVPVDPLVGERMERLTQADDATLGNNPSRVPGTLTTADIMGTPQPQSIMPAPEPAPFEEAEPVVETPPPPDAELLADFLSQVETLESVDDLAQHQATADSSNELSDLSKDMVRTAIQRRKAKLTRGERSNQRQ